MKPKKIKVNLLVKILIAIALGIGAGSVLPMWAARTFMTFNAFFSEFLNLCIPLIIIGFVAPAIGEIGRSAGKLLVFTVLLAYISTTGAGFISYLVSNWSFPSLISPNEYIGDVQSKMETAVTPFFTVAIPFNLNVTTALILSFIIGLGCARRNISNLFGLMTDIRTVIQMVITGFIIPLLPLYIFGIFMNMTISGQVVKILEAFAKIIGVIFCLHVGQLLLQFTIAAFLTKKSTPTRNPLKMLCTMLPAYFTALGTSSSAATIPVTLRQTIKMGVSPEIAGFTVPLCATVHMSGSALKITACVLALMIMHGISYNFAQIAGFIAMLGITIVAAPGVPGGVIMACLGLLQSLLGFSDADNAIMIALYITMDSFGTACNITGDGALSVIVDRFSTWLNRKPAPATLPVKSK